MPQGYCRVQEGHRFIAEELWPVEAGYVTSEQDGWHYAWITDIQAAASGNMSVCRHEHHALEWLLAPTH